MGTYFTQKSQDLETAAVNLELRRARKTRQTVGEGVEQI